MIETLAPTKEALKGGEFLVKESQAEDIFIVEEFSEEQMMMAQACDDFVEKEIQPNIEKMEKQEGNFVPELLEKAGELGLLGVSIPEEYGGLGMDFNTSMLIADYISTGGSFSTTFGAHTGIGMLPILYYGTEEQKHKYLPGLCSGELKACYCLTEPDSGSDANSGKTKAVLNEAGTHYHITGQKMWITNGGFADVFIVFAKIEDDKNLTAFIVERNYGGITMNEEEQKLGIKGSSTRQVFFNDCPVPAENMLSDRQNGFKIAVNILNIGRIKLGAATCTSSKKIASIATNYANERKQFGVSIGSFGAIQHKLAEMAIRAYAIESAAYRAGQYVEDKVANLIEGGMDANKAKLKSLEEYAVECAIIKVHGSEVLDYTTDEGIQVYGGMGFSAEAPMERYYRDARIARIYEGTNEINRMLIVSMLLRKAQKGELDLMGPAKAVAQELLSVPSFNTGDSDATFAAEKTAIRNLKKSALMIAGKAFETYGKSLAQQQEVLMSIADIIIETYVAESTVLRTEKLIGIKGEGACADQIAITKVYVNNAVEISARAGREAIYTFEGGDEQRVMLMGLKRFTKVNPTNVVALRRQIASTMLEKNEYAF